MGNYDWREIFNREPVAIAGAIRTLLWVTVLVGILTDPPFSTAVLAGIALAIEVVLNLFVRAKVTPTAAPKLDPGTVVTPTDGGAATTVK